MVARTADPFAEDSLSPAEQAIYAAVVLLMAAVLAFLVYSHLATVWSR